MCVGGCGCAGCVGVLRSTKCHVCISTHEFLIITVRFVCRLSYVHSLVGHEGPVSVVATSPTLGDIASVCTSKKPKHTTSERLHQLLTDTIAHIGWEIYSITAYIHTHESNFAWLHM